MSSALENTRRMLAVLLLVCAGPRNLDNIERDLLICAGPTSPCTCCTTCTTQCLPGTRSHANAADFSPKCSILSGIRSYPPSAAYCTNRPAVTKTNIFSASSGVSLILEKRFDTSLLASCPVSASPISRTAGSEDPLFPNPACFLIFCARRSVSTDVAGHWMVPCLIA